MSTIKDAVIDAEDALAAAGRDEYTPAELAKATDASRRTRAELMAAYDDLRQDSMSIQHRTLRTVLMKLHGVKPDAEGAFNARLKHVLDLDLIEDRRGQDERRRTYGLVDVLEIALCLQLQRCYVPPATAVRFIIKNRLTLDKFWSQGKTGHAPRLYIEMDAFAAIGDEGRDKRRGSRGNEIGTISLDRLAHLRAEAMPPSSLTIDTVDLQRRVDDQLVRVGAIKAVTVGGVTIISDRRD